MLPRVAEGEGSQEAGENPARSRHCDRGASPSDRATAASELKRWEGPGRAGIRESGDWSFAHLTRMGRGPWRRFYGRQFPRTAHLFRRDAPVELVDAGASVDVAFRYSLGQWGFACSVARAGGVGDRLPARVRPRRASPARRSLPLRAGDDLGLPAPGDGG